MKARNIEPNTDEPDDGPYSQLADIARQLGAQPPLSDRYLWLEAMINHVPDLIYAKDRDGRFIFANDAVVRNNGLRHVAEIVGLTDYDLHGQAAIEARIAEIERRVMETGEPDLGYEERALRGGPDRWLMMSRVPLRDGYGNVIGVVGTSRDISARKASERAMHAQARILEMIVTSVDIPRFLHEFALALESLVSGARCMAMVAAPHDGGAPVVAAPSMAEDRLAPLRGKTLSQAEMTAHLDQVLDGAAGPTSSCHRRDIPAADGAIHGMFGLAVPKDAIDFGLSEFVEGAARMAGIAIDRRIAEERIRSLAERDGLTGLPNRTFLNGALPRILEEARQAGAEVALGFLDLDNFKLINDSYGHGCGDLLLKRSAERILAGIGADGLVARIGGDEFVLVLRENDEGFLPRLKRIRNLVGQPLTAGAIELQVTCSIGIARFPVHGHSAADLLANADAAMYRVKDRGRDGLLLFSEGMAGNPERGSRRTISRITEIPPPDEPC